MERWVVVGWDHRKHNSAQLIHIGKEVACKRIQRDFLQKRPRNWQAVAMTELAWKRILAADERGS
jgi:hypothetical protein